MELIEFLTVHIDVVDRLTKAGKISLIVKQELDIYLQFEKKTGGKMERYEEVAEEMGLSLPTVRRAVREMKKVV
jgi:hypothetical protein